ncbi:alpha/beta hydrolase [Lunatibacter salilacus]|uniref:alpha/beta hydrolase n=1 Tax=Lunatibacter salilacus TaxID=2483804 RepID=UPI00131B8504|nr:alpha/beta hydrolase [Lunatibacter salilacus]
MNDLGKQQVSYTQQNYFLTSHDPSGTEKEIWLILHGYGQLAEFFLRKFRPFFDSSRLFVAPEGINRSYLEGFSGRVGANWMTKHQRETDILNGMNYLNAVVKEVLKTFDDRPEINVLGFSQGAATVSRWVVQSPLPIQKMVLLGGALAVDLDKEKLQEKAKNLHLILATGNSDPLITPERLKEQLGHVETVAFRKLSNFTYAGGHELDEQLLRQIIVADGAE